MATPCYPECWRILLSSANYILRSCCTALYSSVSADKHYKQSVYSVFVLGRAAGRIREDIVRSSSVLETSPTATHSLRSAGLVMITRLLAGYYTSGALSPRPADYYSCWSHSSINRHNSLPCPYSESVIRLRVARHAPTPRHADALHYFFAVTCENSWYAIKDRRSAKISLYKRSLQTAVTNCLIAILVCSITVF